MIEERISEREKTPTRVCSSFQNQERRKREEATPQTGKRRKDGTTTRTTTKKRKTKTKQLHQATQLMDAQLEEELKKM
jgi:hypothetical protein